MEFRRIHIAVAVLLLWLGRASAAVFYVDVNSTNPTPPYASWSTASTDIQSAVDAANAGDLVLVNDGVYQSGGRATPDGTTNRVVVAKALTIQSVNGAAAVLIDGGAAMRCLYLTNGAALVGITLTNGSAGNGAGAMCASTNVWVSSCLLVNNTATSGGGIYYGTLTNCTISGNTCPPTGGNGGGAAGSTLYNCTLSGNVTGRTYPNGTGSTWGGGANGCLLYNCTLSGNTVYGAGAHGGGAVSSTLVNCVISGSYADDYGGGAYNCNATNCTFANNYAIGGGAVSGGSYVNCLMYGNRAAGDGGAVYWTTTLYNCTVTGNSAGYGGGGFSCTFYNSIIYGNTYGGDNYGDTCIYCCTPDTAGTGNVTNAPLFVNASGHDYHLQSGSPGIDAGTNLYVSTAGDLDGNLRIVNGTVDMGCYEFHTASPLLVTIEANYTNVVVGYPVVFTGLYTGGKSNVWNFADGTFATNLFTVSHTWTNTGNFQVALTLYDDNYPNGVAGYFTVHVISPPLVYVSQNSVNPVPPYSSWATAATNIQDAVDISNPGYHIIVTNGLYQYGGRVVYGALTNRLVIARPVLVQSVNGPAVTIIAGNPVVGDSAVRCVYATNGVTLSGFTLTNGATRAAGDAYKEQSGGGIWCEPTSVVVTNCFLLSNVAQNAGGGSCGGNLVNSALVANSASGAGGGAYSNVLTGCLLSNNLVVVPYSSYSQPAGGGASGCSLFNCLIASNIVDNGGWGYGSSGGGVCNSALYGCTLYNNTANGSGAGALSSTLWNCIVFGNTATGGYGGGGNGCAFNGCLIASNSAAVGGGAYECSGTNCVVTANISTYQGGGVSSGSWAESILSFNSGSVGGGASADTYGAGATLINCTVYGNSASFSGGGIDGGAAWNSIIVSNTSPSGTNYYGMGANTLNYCCTQPLPPDGVANITNDPIFVNGPGGDFHLQTGSPCVNAGTNGVINLTNDFDGNPRITGGTIDLGPYEFQSPTYITQQPVSQIAYVGQTVGLQVTAVSPLQLSYQWQVNGTNLIGATNSTLLFTNVQVANSGTYNLIISNSSQVFSSAKAVLTVYYTPLVILSQPTNQYVVLGSNALIAVSAYSPYPTTFQWQFNGTNLANNGRITGSTNPVLSVAPSQLTDSGAYQVIISNQYAVATSAVASVTVLGAPVFSSQPAGVVTTVFGGAQSFTAAASGAPPLVYQWQKNGTNLANGGETSGVNTTNLVLSNPVTTDTGNYTLVASNSFGVTVSSSATLTVLPVFLWGDWYTHPPSTVTNIVAVSAGGDVTSGDFNLALRGDGAVVAWGGGYNGSTTVPPAATNVLAIAAGDFFGLALRQDGVLVGWGDNTYGQASPPSNATNVIAIAAGHYHGLALKQDGTVIGWGENSYGESTTPAGVSNVVAIAAGGNYSLALLQNGTVVGWGNTNYGVTVPPPNATNIVAIAAGEEHAVALRMDGTVIGWGFNGYGYDVVPASATNMIAIAAGNTFSSALRADGTMLNWGYGDNGSAYAPSFITNVVAISAKEYQNLVLVQDPTTQVAPTFSRQPGNVSVATGQTAILNPQALGSLPINYQWYFNGAPLSGQTNNWLALVSISTNQAGNYQVVATNNFGAATSLVAVVSEPPGIATQPASQAAFVGGSVTFTSSAFGIGPFGYQWYSNGVPLADSTRFSGSASNSLTISNIQMSDAGSYSLVASNALGNSSTTAAALDVVSQPTNVMVLQGNTATMSVTSAGPTGVIYQWAENGTPLSNGGRISGATNASLVISGALVGDSGGYEVVAMATNSSISTTSSVATLTVLAPATITGQPASQAVLLGGTATFTAGVSGSALEYQWFENGVPLSDNGHIGGSTTATLNIFNVQSADAASYSLLVSNALSSAVSMGAVLTPLAAPGPSLRYVNLNNLNPAVPYLSWGTAATNIQDAIDAAVNGDTITVTDGVYQAGGRVMFGAMTNRVAINKALTVQSANGLAATTIVGNRLLGNNAVRCIYLTNNATLVGFTLAGGATKTSGDPLREESGGGAWCLSTNSRILSCLIISNSAWLNGGGECFGTLSNCAVVGNAVTNTYPAYGGGTYSGILYNCILSNNVASVYGGGGFSNTLINCVLSGNLATNRVGFNTSGGGAYLSKLNFCVVSNNASGPGVGGGVSFSVLNNCQVFSNFSTSYGGGGEYSLFTNCVILGNQAAGPGAGADASAMYNCLVALNHAVNTSAGAAANNSTSICCTVVANSTTYSGGLGGLSSGKALNSIVYSNLGANSYVTVMTNCCTIPMPEGSPVGANYGANGDFTNAPMFVNLAGGDFHLQSNSPCINAGKNSFVTASTDLDGNPRIQGGTVDVGAYEYQTPTSILPYVWAQQYGLPTDGSADYADSDGTGMNNWQKWIAGLNPTNPASVLVMLPLAATNNITGLKVGWQSVNTRTYYLMRSTNLAAKPAFSTIQSNITGQATSTSVTDTGATNSGPYFYRVGVQ